MTQTQKSNGKRPSFTDWPSKPANPCFRCGSPSYSSDNCPVCADQRSQFERWVSREPERERERERERAAQRSEDDIAAEKILHERAAKQAARAVLSGLHGTGVSHDRDVVMAAQLLKSGWANGDCFFAISGGGHMVRFWDKSDPNVPKWANEKPKHI